MAPMAPKPEPHQTGACPVPSGADISRLALPATSTGLLAGRGIRTAHSQGFKTARLRPFVCPICRPRSVLARGAFGAGHLATRQADARPHPTNRSLTEFQRTLDRARAPRPVHSGGGSSLTLWSARLSAVSFRTNSERDAASGVGQACCSPGASATVRSNHDYVRSMAGHV
jgi:hypothetical protein